MGELSFSRITLPPFSVSPAFLSGVDTSFFGEGVASLCVSSVPLLFCAEKNYMLNETKGIMITETRTYFPITVLFNYTWTLNFKSQLTIIFIYCIFRMLSIWRNEPWNTETHKTGQINQSKSQITNHDLLNFLKQASVFPKRSAKIIDSSKECKHRLAFKLRRWHVLKSAVKCMLNEHGDLQNKEVN